MSTHALVLRQFSGFVPGEVVDTTNWLHTDSLTSDRFLAPMERADVEDTTDCGCGKRIIKPLAPTSVPNNLHDCDYQREERAKRTQQTTESAQPAPAPTTATTPPTSDKTAAVEAAKKAAAEKAAAKKAEQQPAAANA